MKLYIYICVCQNISFPCKRFQICYFWPCPTFIFAVLENICPMFRTFIKKSVGFDRKIQSFAILLF